MKPLGLPLPIARVQVDVYADRGHLLASAKLPAHLAADLHDLVVYVQTHDPAITPDEVLRAIWRYGSCALARQVRGALATKRVDHGNAQSFTREAVTRTIRELPGREPRLPSTAPKNGFAL